jgi:hypothetical protein
MRKNKRGKEDGEVGVEIALNPPRKNPQRKGFVQCKQNCKEGLEL